LNLPVVKAITVESIVDEVYSKNSSFGVEEFRSSLEENNPELAMVVYSFIDALSDYMAGNDNGRREECCAIGKIACHLMYKSLEKQMEINNMEER
jgi:hypothetical protein